MPFINVKLVKNQVTLEQKNKIISGITDLIVNIMGRDRNFTVITVDELDSSQWAIGGKTLSESSSNNSSITCTAVSFINIKVSKGTTNAEEARKMLKAGKDLMVDILGNSHEANYFIIDELNPELWGFDGLSMTDRSKL